MPEDELPDDDQDNGWTPQSERRSRLANDTMQRHALGNIAQAQRELKRDLDRLRDVVAKDVEAGTERTFLIRRVEERLNEMYARFLVVEARYVTKDDHEKALAPFRKWGSWIAMLVIGMVVTAVVGTVLVKGGVR
jgi:hypothetical protein